MIRLTIDQAAEQLATRAKTAGNGRLFVPYGPGEPLGLLAAFRRNPDLADGLTFVGAAIPGINRNDWSAIHPAARAEGTFAGADWREGLEAGRYALRPMTWFQTYGWLGETALGAAVVQVSPPVEGRVTLSVASDLAPAVLARPDLFKLAIVNPGLPAVTGPSWPIEAFDAVCEDDHLVHDYEAGGLDPAFEVIAGHIAAVAPEGASLQFGVGKAGVAALAGLKDRRGLKIWSGMVSDPLVELLDAGAVDGVVTGLAAGTARLRERLGDPRIRFEPSNVTHSIRRLAEVPRLTAVNSALEIDLFGQANAEYQDGRPISGIGGLTDFLRGARLSEGGLPILALPASARKGAISRIVPRLPPGVVSVPRQDMGLVITEHGVADVRDKTLDERAAALIAVADPGHRDSLANAWDGMRRA